MLLLHTWLVVTFRSIRSARPLAAHWLKLPRLRKILPSNFCAVVGFPSTPSHSQDSTYLENTVVLYTLRIKVTNRARGKDSAIRRRKCLAPRCFSFSVWRRETHLQTKPYVYCGRLFVCVRMFDRLCVPCDWGYLRPVRCRKTNQSGTRRLCTEKVWWILLTWSGKYKLYYVFSFFLRGKLTWCALRLTGVKITWKTCKSMSKYGLFHIFISKHKFRLCDGKKNVYSIYIYIEVHWLTFNHSKTIGDKRFIQAIYQLTSLRLCGWVQTTVSTCAKSCPICWSWKLA